MVQFALRESNAERVREMVGGSIFRSTGQEGLSEKGSMSEEDTAGYYSEMFEIATAVTYFAWFLVKQEAS